MPMNGFNRETAGNLAGLAAAILIGLYFLAKYLAGSGLAAC